MSLRLRLITAAVVLLGALALYFALARSRTQTPHSSADIPWKSGADGLAWYERQRPALEKLRYVRLDDSAGLKRAVDEIITHRAPGDPFDTEELAQCVCAFLTAMALNDPQDYLRAVQPHRRLREDAGGDPLLHALHRRIFNEPMASKPDPALLLERFWRSQISSTGRPTLVATSGAAQVLLSNPLPTAPRDPAARLLPLISPKRSLFNGPDGELWMGPFCEGFPQITAPLTALADVLASHGQTQLATLHLAVRAGKSPPFVIGLVLYYSPDEHWWHIDSVYDYYPYEVCWPY